MPNYLGVPDSQAIETFENLWTSSRPWILIYLGGQGTGKSPFLSWLIENRCEVSGIPYSLVSFSIYTPDIDTLLASIAESIIMKIQISRDEVVDISEKLTGQIPIDAHWIGQHGQRMDNTRMVLFFDDYQIFEENPNKELLYTFLDRINHIHMRLPDLRVVIASRGDCDMPTAWRHLEEFIYFEPENGYFRL